MRSRILVGLIAGTIGGFLGWLIQENLIHYQAHLVNGVCTAVDLTSSQTVCLMLCVGGGIGLLLGAVDGIVESNGHKLIKGMAIGAFAGFLLGSIGYNLGGQLFSALGGTVSMRANPGLFDFVKQIIARTAGFSFLGMGIGGGSAIATLSFKRIRNGLIGGLIGGFIGGFVFDMVAANASAPVQGALGAAGCHDSGGPSRAIGFVLIGALTGFFVNLIEELLKDAWVKVLAGRNEGKDFILGKSMNLLGRDERCDVPLYGDNSVGAQHAAIRADGNRHVLIDGKTPAGTLVNGQKVASGGEQLLRDGDMIQIGQHRILFREKVTASKFARKPVDAPKANSPASSVPMPGHLCPYCGAAKDSSGNCLCTLAGSGAGATPGMGTGPAPGFGTPPPMAGYAPSDYGSPGMGATPGYGAPVATMGGMGTQIVGVEGPYTGQGFPLLGPNMVIGREMTCDIALTADTTVSRNHARLVQEGAGLVVYDNGSSNGTYVNGMRVTAPVMLAPGDIVQFGSSKFRLE